VPYDHRAIDMLNGTLNVTVDELLEGKDKCVLLQLYCTACLPAPTDVSHIVQLRWGLVGCQGSQSHTPRAPTPGLPSWVCTRPYRPRTLHASMCRPPWRVVQAVFCGWQREARRSRVWVSCFIRMHTISHVACSCAFVHQRCCWQQRGQPGGAPRSTGSFTCTTTRLPVFQPLASWGCCLGSVAAAGAARGHS
jgi:hypothetical protein